MKNRQVKTNRPLLVWLTALWSLIRAIFPVIGLYGSYQIYKQYAFLGDNPFNSTNTFPNQTLHFLNGTNTLPNQTLPFLKWAISSNGLSTFIETAILFFVFLALIIGIISGAKWGSLGFIVTSALLVIWRSRFLFYPFIQFAPILFSLAAFLVAFWIFRRPEVCHFFKLKYRFGFLQIKNIPIDLSLGFLSLFAAMYINYFGI